MPGYIFWFSSKGTAQKQHQTREHVLHLLYGWRTDGSFPRSGERPAVIRSACTAQAAKSLIALVFGAHLCGVVESDRDQQPWSAIPALALNDTEHSGTARKDEGRLGVPVTDQGPTRYFL